MSAWRLALAWPVGLAGSAAGLLTVLGFLGRWWWGFDILSSFRPQYLVAGVTTGLVVGALASWPAGLALVAAALLNVAVIAPLYLGSGPEPGAGPRLGVVAFNVQASNRQRPAVMDWVRDQDHAHLVFFVESSFEWEDAAERAALPFTIEQRVPLGRVFGITLLVREGLAVESRPLILGDRGAVEATVTLEEQRIAVLAIHPRSPTSKERADRRDEYLRLVASWARSQEGPALVVGDFNATPWSSSFRRLTAGAGLRNSQVGFGLQPTFPAGWGPLMIPIDHALHTPDLAVEERRTGPPLGSDHRPLIISVAPAAG